jgi:hypothetical protein
MDNHTEAMDGNSRLERLKTQIGGDEERFPVDPQYFDQLSGNIMERVGKPAPLVAWWKPYLRFSAALAAAASVVLLIMVLQPDKREEVDFAVLAEEIAKPEATEETAELIVFDDSQALSTFAEDEILPGTDIGSLSLVAEPEEDVLVNLGEQEMEEYLINNLEISEL